MSWSDEKEEVRTAIVGATDCILSHLSSEYLNTEQLKKLKKSHNLLCEVEEELFKEKMEHGYI